MNINPVVVVSLLGTATLIALEKIRERLGRPVFKFLYEDYEVLVSSPKDKFLGKYFIVVKELPPSKKVIVRATPIVSIGENNRIKVIWQKDRGEEKNELLKSIMDTFFKEIVKSEETEVKEGELEKWA